MWGKGVWNSLKNTKKVRVLNPNHLGKHKPHLLLINILLHLLCLVSYLVDVVLGLWGEPLLLAGLWGEPLLLAVFLFIFFLLSIFLPFLPLSLSPPGFECLILQVNAARPT